MKRLFRLSGYPGLLVFVLAGLAAAVFAYSTYNLLSLSMANLSFLRDYGWQAITSGGLVQLLGILANGAVALACWLVFKACENELIDRYRRWQDR